MPPKLAKAAKGYSMKVPKGTRDWVGNDVVLREQIFDTIKNVFRSYGGDELDTPVFELKSTLTGKYGEDSKLIYDLDDQGGEICSLRYDLTVPMCRYLAMNRDVQKMKRFTLGKVYRRDQPAMTKGRMREFYQCDFDIVGTYDSMSADAQIIAVIEQVFEDLGWAGKYTVKINHRKILDGIFQVCGVEESQFRTISSAVDKLDKLSWQKVKKEMLEKGLTEEVADKIGVWVGRSGRQDLLIELQQDEVLSSNAMMKQGLEDMDRLFTFLKQDRLMDIISFDLSLARGLDYYTGIIFEVITEGSRPEVSSSDSQVANASHTKNAAQDADTDEDRSNDPTVGVGSIAAGGRYDNLVSLFTGGRRSLPCVGISFGVDRIISIVKSRMAQEKSAWQKFDVYIMALGSKEFTGYDERRSLFRKFQKNKIRAETSLKAKSRMQDDFKAAEDLDIPYAIIIGESEYKKGQVRIKRLGLPEGHPEKDGVPVNLDTIVDEMKARLEKNEGAIQNLGNVNGGASHNFGNIEVEEAYVVAGNMAGEHAKYFFK